MLLAEKEVLKKVDYKKIINDFASRKAKKISFT